METHTSDRWAFRPVGPEQGHALTSAWESLPKSTLEAFAISCDRFCAAGPSEVVFGSTADLHDFDASKFTKVNVKSPRQICALCSCQFVVVTDTFVFVYSQEGEIQWRYEAPDIQSVHAHPNEPNFAFCSAKGQGYMVIDGEVMKMDATQLLWDHTGDTAAVISHKDIILGNQRTGEQHEYRAENDVVYANFINETLFIATSSDKLFVLQNDSLIEVPELCPAFGDPTRVFSWYFSDLSGWQDLDLAACAFSKSSDLGLISPREVIEPLEDDAKALMPLNEETYVDTSPVGAAVDWTARTPAKLFSDSETVAPIFWVLNNLGHLVGWSIASRDALDENAKLKVPPKVKEVTFTSSATKAKSEETKAQLGKEINAKDAHEQPRKTQETEAEPKAENRAEPKEAAVAETEMESKETEQVPQAKSNEVVENMESEAATSEVRNSEPVGSKDTSSEQSAKGTKSESSFQELGHEAPKTLSGSEKGNEPIKEVQAQEKKETKRTKKVSEDIRSEQSGPQESDPEVQNSLEKRETKVPLPEEKLKSSQPEAFASSSSSPLSSRWAKTESTPQKSDSFFRGDNGTAFGGFSAESSFDRTFGQGTSFQSSRATSGGVFDESGPRLSFGKPKAKQDVSQSSFSDQHESESSIQADHSASYFGFTAEDKRPDSKKSFENTSESKDYSNLSINERFGANFQSLKDDEAEEEFRSGDEEETGSDASEQEFEDESNDTETELQEAEESSHEDYGSESDTEASDSEPDLDSDAQNQLKDGEELSSDTSYERIETPLVPRMAPIKSPADSPPAVTTECGDHEEKEAEESTEKLKNPSFDKSPFAEYNGQAAAFGSALKSNGGFGTFANSTGGSPFRASDLGSSGRSGNAATPAFKFGESSEFASFEGGENSDAQPSTTSHQPGQDQDSKQPQKLKGSPGSSPVIVARGTTAETEEEEPIVTEPEDDEFSESDLHETANKPELEDLPEFDNINSTECHDPTGLLPFAPQEYWDLGTLDQVYAETNSFFQVIDNNIQVLGSYLQDQVEVPEGSNLMTFDLWTLAKSSDLTPILDEQQNKLNAKQLPTKAALSPILEQLGQLLNDTRQLGQSLQQENTKKSVLELMQMPYQSKQYQFQLRTKISQCRKLLQHTEEKLMLVRVQCGERPASVDLMMACEILERQIARLKEQYPEIFNKPWDLTSLELGIVGDRFDRQKFMDSVDKSKKIKNLAKILQERTVTPTVGQ